MWILTSNLMEIYPLNSDVKRVKMPHMGTVFALCILLFPSCQTHFTQRINGVVIAVVQHR